MDSSAYTISAYLRITSIAVALYDYLETTPTAWQYYKDHWRRKRFSSSLILFVLIRTTSVAVLVLSSVGFFYSHFDTRTCRMFYLLPPAFKVLQGMVSQVILGIRAWNLSRRSKGVCYFLIALYLAATVLEWVSTLYGRSPSLALDETGKVQHGNCRAYSKREDDNWGAWVYYLVAFLYDFATVSVSFFFLLKYKRTSSNSSMMNKVIKMMLYDGMFYFIALAGVNFANLVFFRTSAGVQTAAASLGYAVSWIMSQRMLFHVHRATRERNQDTSEKAITITENLSARDVSRAVRTQFEMKDTNTTYDLTFPRRSGPDPPEDSELDQSMSVQVRVERTVKLDRALRSYELEDYSMSSRRR